MAVKKMIYIVEDHVPNIQLYKAIFDKMDNIEVKCETRGDKGLEMIKNGNPDLIILDYKLPEMDGITICASIRNIDRFKTVPIIAVSSSPIKGNREEIFSQAGFNELISKPINIKNLRKITEKYLNSEKI